jgi:hypothetical protein
MPEYDEYGYLSNPINGLGIVRARTVVGNLRMWDIPRSEEALETVVNEIGHSPIPSLYMLFDERSEKKVYIGQTENLKGRLTTHMKTPEDKIKNWDRAIVINDGRNASQSDLNDENIRLVLEDYLVKLFKLNKYKIVTDSSRSPSLSSHQKILFLTYKEEIAILLSKKDKISKFITERADSEVYLDETKKILQRKGWSIQEWSDKYAVVNNLPAIIRPGSSKRKGWQVTFRGSKSLLALKDGNGYLLMPRGKVLLIPLKEIRDFVLTIDASVFDRDTIDVFVRFDDNKIVLVYKDSELIITHHSVQEYP